MRNAPFVIALCVACSATPTPTDWDKRVLDTAYRSEGVAVFDVDRDGHMDIVTDQFWYSGPSLVAHELRAPESFDPAREFCHSFAVIPWDVDGDGWQDVVIAPHVNGDPMLWYRNPAGADVHWEAHELAPQGAAGLETPIAVDLFGEGRLVLLSSDSRVGVLGWQVPGSDPTQHWPMHPISGENFPGAAMAVHGIGAGDVDGDGKLDVLTPYGWFQATNDHLIWTWHSISFGPASCSRMFAADLDGDGLADVLCSHPHEYGLRWFQQQPPFGGERTFVERVVDDTVSQLHALRFDDVDGDGKPDIVSGKRFWAHGPTIDPGVGDPALLAYWTIDRGAGHDVVFHRHVIDADSGVGAQFAIADVDGDGKVDVVTSNKKGLFYFRRR